MIVGVALLVGALGSWLFFPALSIPSNRLTGWQLHGFIGHGFDPTTAQTTTLVRVAVAQWPVEFAQDDSSWLARRGSHLHALVRDDHAVHERRLHRREDARLV